jgi:putative acetyltransferase
MNPEFIIRPIQIQDDPTIAAIIREVMPSFGANGPGFALSDPEVDFMSQAYARERAAYFVVELAGHVVGGGGVAPLENGSAQICELRKMYFLPVARGIGAGRALIEQCLEAAKNFGYQQCYLETLTGMDAAQALYQKVGFQKICNAMGNTGHHGCDRFYLKDM